MLIVLIAWLYVALMMAVAEATHSQGSVLGAIVTFSLYGVGPVALVLYLMGTPTRRRRTKERERLEEAAQAERAKQAEQGTPPPTDKPSATPNQGEAPPA